MFDFVLRRRSRGVERKAKDTDIYNFHVEILRMTLGNAERNLQITVAAIYKASNEESWISRSFAEEQLNIPSSETTPDDLVIFLRWRCQDIGQNNYESSFKVAPKLTADIVFGSDSPRKQPSSSKNLFDEAINRGSLKRESSWKLLMVKPVEGISKRRQSWSLQSNSRKNSGVSMKSKKSLSVNPTPYSPSSPQNQTGAKLTSDTPPTSPIPERSGNGTWVEPQSPREHSAPHIAPFHSQLPETPTSMQNSMTSWPGSQSSRDILSVGHTQFPQDPPRPEELQISPIFEDGRQSDEPSPLGDESQIDPSISHYYDPRRHQDTGDSGISGISGANFPSRRSSELSEDLFPESPRTSSAPQRREHRTERQTSDNNKLVLTRNIIVSVPVMGSLRECPENASDDDDEPEDPRFPADYWKTDPDTNRQYRVDKDGQRVYWEPLD